jgi:hypothetical protein
MCDPQTELDRIVGMALGVNKSEKTKPMPNFLPMADQIFGSSKFSRKVFAFGNLPYLFPRAKVPPLYFFE